VLCEYGLQHVGRRRPRALHVAGEEGFIFQLQLLRPLPVARQQPRLLQVPSGPGATTSGASVSEAAASPPRRSLAAAAPPAWPSNAGFWAPAVRQEAAHAAAFSRSSASLTRVCSLPAKQSPRLCPRFCFIISSSCRTTPHPSAVLARDSSVTWQAGKASAALAAAPEPAASVPSPVPTAAPAPALAIAPAGVLASVAGELWSKKNQLGRLAATTGSVRAWSSLHLGSAKARSGFALEGRTAVRGSQGTSTPPASSPALRFRRYRSQFYSRYRKSFRLRVRTQIT